MILLLAALLAAPAGSPPPAAAVLRMLQSTIHLHDVALSGDGNRVAWVEQVPTPDGPAADESIIQVVDRSGPQGAVPLRVTASKDGKAHDENDLDFSPDGGSL